MRDLSFFSLASALALAFVVTALQPFVYRPPSGPLSCGGCIIPDDKTIAGEELHRFLPGNFDSILIVKTAEANERVLRISLLAEETYENPLFGPHLVLAEDLEVGLEARTVEVVIEARSAGEFGASQFQANYMAKPDAESGWHTFNLTSEFAPHSFTYQTPQRGANLSYDYFGIRPVTPDKRRVMDVRSIRFHAITPKAAPAG